MDTERTQTQPPAELQAEWAALTTQLQQAYDHYTLRDAHILAHLLRLASPALTAWVRPRYMRQCGQCGAYIMPGGETTHRDDHKGAARGDLWSWGRW
jgi:hypothetical protein